MPSRPFKFFLLVAISCALLACSNRIQVTEYPEHFDPALTKLDSYCWANSSIMADKHMHGNPVEEADPTGGHHSSYDQMVRDTIDEQLQKKNYRKTDCANASFHIDYRMNTHEDVVAMDAASTNPEQPGANTHSFKWKIGDRGETSYEGISGPEDQVITVRHGTLHVGAFLANHHLVWHGSAEKNIDARDTEADIRSNIKHAARKIMRNFPEHTPGDK